MESQEIPPIAVCGTAVSGSARFGESAEFLATTYGLKFSH
jgi:hypothetical protein